ncbi:MAG: hypothetical protein WC740_24235, partial [Verrucomicrobiia bacterium]
RGRHRRIRLCNDFYWWWAKQLAADLAREAINQCRTTITPEGFQVDENGEKLGIEKSAFLAATEIIRHFTHTEGLSPKQIAKFLKHKPAKTEHDVERKGDIDRDAKKDMLWDIPVFELPPECFLPGDDEHGIVSRADRLRLRNLIIAIRRERLAQGKKSGHVSKSALAEKFDISMSTFRRKGYAAWYDAHYRKHVHQQSVDAEQLGHRDDLVNQGIQTVIESEAKLPGVSPIRKGDAFKAAQPHLKVIEAFENGQFSHAKFCDYVKHLPIEEHWALRGVLVDKGYAEDRLRNMGFPKSAVAKKALSKSLGDPSTDTD